MPEQSQSLGGRGQLYRSIFERSALGIILLDGDGRIIECNSAFAAMLGYTKDELRDVSLAQITHPQDRETDLVRLQKSLTSSSDNGQFQAEKRYLHKNGHVVWGRLNATVIRDAKGEPVFGLRMVEDITERKRTEAALQESEQRYRLLFNEMLNGFALHEIICDAAGKPVDYRFLEVNPAFEQLTGLRREDILGKTVRQMTPDIESFWIERYGAVAQTGMPVHFESYSRDYKKHFDVIAYSPSPGQFAVTFTDVTERREAQDKLSAEKERLAVTLRSIGDGVIATDADGRILLLNRAAESMTGWTQEQAVGRPLADVFTIAESSAHDYDRLFQQVVEGRAEMEFIEPLVLLDRDGRQRIVGATSNTIRDRNSAVVGVVLAFHDITEKQKLEEEQIRADKLESLGFLAGGIAHDFNNLLTAVLGNISLARTQAEQGNNDLTNLLKEAEDATLRASALTQQLLTFAKGGSPIKQKSELADLVREAAEFAVRGSSSSVEFIFPSDLWPVEVDPGQISQVIRNLVINADQAMHGGKIVIRGENMTLDESLPVPIQPGRYVKISIADTGVGIPEAALSKVFDPYFTTKTIGGGLGLPTSRSIVTKHGGHIAVRSTVGKGTTFEIYLPAHLERTPAQPPPQAAPPKATGAARILIMDDEQAIRQLAVRMLASRGYEVHTAADGTEAIRIFDAARNSGAPFHIVVLDLTVQGGMGGKETIRKLRENDPSVKAIVSSGYSTDPVMSNYRDFGFQGVVAKPYQSETFLRTIKDVLAETDGSADRPAAAVNSSRGTVPGA